MKKKIKHHCPKCGNKICFDRDKICDGYFGVCLNCDEDFYKFELLKKKGKK